ncbi:MAG: hypothetical protein E6G66_03145 [Actinobacteria bacterium]|nr:MAG: hypothetical protein E6G66_03145 [Actinomycetota bacterium]
MPAQKHVIPGRSVTARMATTVARLLMFSRRQQGRWACGRRGRDGMIRLRSLLSPECPAEM